MKDMKGRVQDLREVNYELSQFESVLLGCDNQQGHDHHN